MKLMMTRMPRLTTTKVYKYEEYDQEHDFVFSQKAEGTTWYSDPFCLLSHILGSLKTLHHFALTKVRWKKQKSLGVSLTNPQF